MIQFVYRKDMRWRRIGQSSCFISQGGGMKVPSFEALIHSCIRGCIIQLFFYHMHMALNYKIEYMFMNFQFQNSIYHRLPFYLHSRWEHVCFVFKRDPKTDNSLFRSWWSLTNIMQMIDSSIGTSSVEYMYTCMHYKDTCSSSSWGQKSTCDS